MHDRNNAQQDGVVRRVGRWSTAVGVVITEAAQHFVAPGAALEAAVDHANTGAVWGLGLQLVAMLGRELYRALPSDGSFTAAVSWKFNSRGSNDTSEKKEDTAQPPPSAAEARVKESVPENEKHGV